MAFRSIPAVVVAALTGCALAAPAARAVDIRGTVFNDFNTDGTRDTGPVGANDAGVVGLTVRAFGADGRPLRSTITDAGGGYAFDGLPDERVRIELDVNRPWWPTRQLRGLRSDVQFVAPSSSPQRADFGIHRVGEFSVADPILYWPLQWAGPPAGGNADRDAIRGAREDSSIVADPTHPPTWAGLPAASRSAPAKFGQIGTVLGLGVDQKTGNLFAGAYYKRFAGLLRRSSSLAHPTGAIFRITPAGAVTLWADIDAGGDGHPASDNIDDWVVPTEPSFDQSWDLVGKRGLGSIAIDPQSRNLYTVDLAHRTLVRVPLSGGPPVSAASTTPIPGPDCDTADDWRPFSVAFDPADGAMYVGGVCSAEQSRKPASLRAVVYRVGGSASAPTFAPVLDVPLDYRRVTSPTVNLDAVHAAVQSDWQPWPTKAALAAEGAAVHSPSDGDRRTRTQHDVETRLMDESYPQLDTIAFDADGSMILGLRDLMGDMSGLLIEGEQFTFPGGIFRGVTAQGDLLRASREAGGAFASERAGVAGSRTEAWTAPLDPIGPGGRFFYDPQTSYSLTEVPSGFQGGVVQIPGFPQVVSTAVDVTTYSENGLLWHRNADGVKNAPGTDVAARRLSNHQTLEARSGFGKANGLGDLAAYRARAPVQIGNRLWYDDNRDGLQDAGESSLPDSVEVELLDTDLNRVIDTTLTDPIGEYVFAIEPEGHYKVRVPLDQRPLDGYTVTQRNAGSNRRLDSNGAEQAGRSVATVGSHGVGENDHTYDFGFHRGTPVTPRAEPVEAPPPPAEAPEVAGEEPEQLILIKYADRASAAAGERAVFTMVVRNPAPDATRGVRVCDELPESLVLLAKSRLGRNVAGRQVCWRDISLESGEARAFRVTTRVGTARVGVIVNRARAGRRSAQAFLRVRERPRVTG